MTKPHFIATIDLGYIAIEIETDQNNVGDPLVEIRESGHSLRLTLEGARMLADALKAAAGTR